MWIHGVLQCHDEKFIDILFLKNPFFSMCYFILVCRLLIFFKNTVDESKSQAYSSLHQLTTQTKQVVSTAL